jgi:hypothetical protein
MANIALMVMKHLSLVEKLVFSFSIGPGPSQVQVLPCWAGSKKIRYTPEYCLCNRKSYLQPVAGRQPDLSMAWLAQWAALGARVEGGGGSGVTGTIVPCGTQWAGSHA